MTLCLLPAEVRSQLRSGVAITSITQCVEELVLNALDSGATCIAIRVDLTSFMIQVVDNGAGMTLQDLEVAGQRYTTSKCHAAADLDNLCHYGYRGEALASIQDVCQVMEMNTRTKLSANTYTKVFKLGKSLDVIINLVHRPSPGTTVIVSGLFYNLPVRQKFLNEILQLDRLKHRLEGISLINHSVSISLRNDVNNTILLQTKKCSNFLVAFMQLFGKNKSQEMTEVDKEEQQFKIHGYIGKDGTSRKNIQYVFINKRLVLKTQIHKIMTNLLCNSLIIRKKSDEEYLSSDNRPVRCVNTCPMFVLNITCPLAEYDITFEPTKTMVEFKDWTTLTVCVTEMTRDFLKVHNLLISLDNVTTSSPNEDESSCPEKEVCLVKNTVVNNETRYGKRISTESIPNGLASKMVKRSILNQNTACTDSDGATESVDCCLDKQENVRSEEVPKTAECSEQIDGIIDYSAAVVSVEAASDDDLQSIYSDTSLEEQTTEHGLSDDEDPIRINASQKCGQQNCLVNLKVPNSEGIPAINSVRDKVTKQEKHDGRCSVTIPVDEIGAVGSVLSNFRKRVNYTQYSKILPKPVDENQKWRKSVDFDKLSTLQRFRKKEKFEKVKSDVSNCSNDTIIVSKSNSEEGFEDCMNVDVKKNTCEVISATRMITRHHKGVATRLRHESSSRLSDKTLHSVVDVVGKGKLLNPTSDLQLKYFQGEPICEDKQRISMDKVLHCLRYRKHVTSNDTVFDQTRQFAHSRKSKVKPRIEINFPFLTTDTMLSTAHSLLQIDPQVQKRSFDYLPERSSLPIESKEDFTVTTNRINDSMKTFEGDIETDMSTHSLPNANADCGIHDICYDTFNIMVQDMTPSFQNKNACQGNDIMGSAYFCNNPEVVCDLYEQHPLNDINVIKNEDHLFKPIDDQNDEDYVQITASQGFVPSIYGELSQGFSAHMEGLTDSNESINVSQKSIQDVNDLMDRDIPSTQGFDPHSTEYYETKEAVYSEADENNLSHHIKASTSSEENKFEGSNLLKLMDAIASDKSRIHAAENIDPISLELSDCTKSLESGMLDCVDSHSSIIGETPSQSMLHSTSSTLNANRVLDANLKSESSSDTFDGLFSDRVLSTESSGSISMAIPHQTEIESRVESNVLSWNSFDTLQLTKTASEKEASDVHCDNSMNEDMLCSANVNNNSQLFSSMPYSALETLIKDRVNDKTENCNIPNEMKMTGSLMNALNPQSVIQDDNISYADSDRMLFSKTNSNSLFSAVGECVDELSFVECFQFVKADVNSSSGEISREDVNERLIPKDNEMNATKTRNDGDDEHIDVELCLDPETALPNGSSNAMNSSMENCEKLIEKSELNVKIVISSNDRNNDLDNEAVIAKSGWMTESVLTINSTDEIESNSDVKNSAFIIGFESHPGSGESDAPNNSVDNQEEGLDINYDVNMESVNAGLQLGPQSIQLNSASDRMTSDSVSVGVMVVPDSLVPDVESAACGIKDEDGAAYGLTDDLFLDEWHGDGNSGEGINKAPLKGASLSQSSVMNLIGEFLEEKEGNAGVKWRNSRCQAIEGDSEIQDLWKKWENPVFERSEKSVPDMELSRASRTGIRAVRTLQPCKFTKAMLTNVKVLGQLDNKFIACLIRSNDSNYSRDLLVLVDQHAAHERVRLEKLTADAYVVQHGPDGHLRTVDVIPPELLTVGADEMHILQAYHKEFLRIGVQFSIEEGNVLMIHGIPACLVAKDVGAISNIKCPLTVVDVILETGRVAGHMPKTLHDALCSQACHGAIKFGDALSMSECEDLLLSLSACKLPFQCAHGRPSITPLVNLTQMRENSSTQMKQKPNLRKIRTRSGIVGVII